MARWMFFAPPGYGHTNPTLPVVDELVRRGERVVYYNSPRFEEAIRATGAEFRPFHGFRPAPKNFGLRMMDLFPLLAEWTEVFLDAELERIRAAPPDFVCYDYTAMWGAEVASSLGVPAVGSMPGIVFNSCVGRLCRRVMPPKLVPGVGLGDAPALWRVFLRRLRTSRKHGLRYRPAMKLLYADFNIAFTSPEIQPCTETLHGRFCFVGPPEARREERIEFPFEGLTGAPLVYISLGTVFNDRVEFFQSCLEALADVEAQVVLARGRPDGDVAPLGKAPENFIVCDFPPQIELLRRAAVFVGHGGLSSTLEALQLQPERGLPIVFYPQIWDQHLTAHQVVEAGAGLRLSERPTPAEIREKVTQALCDPSLRENSRALGARLCSLGGAARAADEMIRWASTANAARGAAGE